MILWRVALLGCSAVLLAQPGASLGDTSKEPGDIHYCVELQSLGISEGHMTPSMFDGKREDYDLEVTNPLSPQVVLTFGLQLMKYNLQHTPIIEVDGKELEYTPLTIISKVIKLDDNIGPFDRVVHVLIRDPNPGSFWHHTNRKEYRIHIRQSPEYSKLVIAEEIVVKGGSGKEIVAETPFNPNSSKVDYVYNVSEEETSVTVEFACPRFTTRIEYNQKPVSMYAVRSDWSPAGTSQTIDMSLSARERVSLTCLYEGKVKRARRDYMLTLNRNVHLDAQVIRPKLLPDLGYCLSRMDYMAKLQSSYSVDSPVPQSDEDGYFCLTDSMHPKLMVESHDPRSSEAEVFLKDKDSPYQVQLQNFLPVAISHSRSRHQLVMDVQLGSIKRDIPLNFIFPATCSSMSCPKHYRLKSAAESQVRAEWRLCMAEECKVDTDRDTCCEKVAPCDSLTCPEGKTPASDMDCLGTSCSQVDELRCCNHHEYCVDTDCPVGYSLRKDAATTPCASKICSIKDHETCCEKQASCKSFAENIGCSDGESPVDIEERHCLHGECKQQDEIHCCGQLTTCKDFACPAGRTLRKEAARLTCFSTPCRSHDAPRCCEMILAAQADNLPVTTEEGTVEDINVDGTYTVKYVTGRVDRSVPEWALKGTDPDSDLNLRVGENVTAASTREGYHHHNFNSGWVQSANADGTYTVKFDNDDWDGAVPAWAVRAVDSEGNRFVHTGMLAPGQRIYTSRQKNGGYKKMVFAVGTVIGKLEDDTFTVQYSSGSVDEHVPVWDLRAITADGRSHVQPDFKVGDYVEVSDQEKARMEQFQPSLRDLLRTKYIFGFVRKVNPDGSYGVKYDCGGWEDSVPNWAIRKIAKGESHKQMKYMMDDRVEARVSEQAAFMQAIAADTEDMLGIATRERLNWYMEIRCWPAAQECKPKPDWAEGGPPETLHEEVPGVGDYDVVRNPNNLTLCYYDSNCEDEPELPGCNAGNDRKSCRYCGFGDNPECPKAFDCRETKNHTAKDWSQPRKDWCCKNFNVGCPFVCRWGKYWPDEAKGWGPWWSPEKRTWCCENKKLGCPRLKNTFDVIVTTTKPMPTTTITAICEDGFALTPVEHGECPSDLDSLSPCETVGAGEICAGTGHCGTDTELDNCGEDSDVYVKQALMCPNSQGVQGYRFAHFGYWVGGRHIGTADSTVQCGIECDRSTECKGFSWQEETHGCFVHEELGNRVLGSPSMAFLRCEQEEMLNLEVKFSGESRRQPEQTSSVFRGSSPTRTWASHTSFLAPVLLAGLSALALAAWSWRMGRGRRRSGQSQFETARALGVAASRAPLRPQPAMVAGGHLHSMLRSIGEDADVAPLL